jgi:hypothetical protein
VSLPITTALQVGDIAPDAQPQRIDAAVSSRKDPLGSELLKSTRREIERLRQHRRRHQQEQAAEVNRILLDFLGRAESE